MLVVKGRNPEIYRQNIDSPICIPASRFLKRTSQNRLIKEIQVKAFNNVEVVLVGGEKIEVPKHFLDLPKLIDKEKLAKYLNESHLELTELSGGIYKLASKVNGLGAGCCSSKVAPEEPGRVINTRSSIVHPKATAFELTSSSNNSANEDTSLPSIPSESFTEQIKRKALERELLSASGTKNTTTFEIASSRNDRPHSPPLTVRRLERIPPVQFTGRLGMSILEEDDEEYKYTDQLPLHLRSHFHNNLVGYREANGTTTEHVYTNPNESSSRSKVPSVFRGRDFLSASSYDQSMHEAVAKMDITSLKEILKKQVGKNYSIDVQNRQGRTALDVANELEVDDGLDDGEKRLNILHLLLAKGANPLLVKNKTKLLGSITHIKNQDTNVENAIHKLLLSGADPNAPTILNWRKEGSYPIYGDISTKSLELLLKFGAEVNFDEDKDSLLCHFLKKFDLNEGELPENQCREIVAQIKLLLDTKMCYMDEDKYNNPLNQAITYFKIRRYSEIKECIDLLLDYGANPYRMFRQGFLDIVNVSKYHKYIKERQISTSPALTNACKTKVKKRVEDAINSGHKPNAQTLTWAFLTGDMTIIDLVHKAGAEPDHETLKAACSLNDINFVRKALSFGARKNSRTIEIAKRTGNQKIMNLVQRHAKSIVIIEHDALTKACIAGNLREVKSALASGIKPDRFTLSWAVGSNNVDIVRAVVEAGAEPHDQAGIPSELTTAVCYCNEKIIEELANHHIVPDIYTYSLAEKFAHKNLISQDCLERISFCHGHFFTISNLENRKSDVVLSQDLWPSHIQKFYNEIK